MPQGDLGRECTVVDPSVGQDPSVGHLKFLAHFSLDHYKIEHMTSSTPP